MKTKVGKQLKGEFMINKIVRDEKKRKEIGEASQVSHCKKIWNADLLKIRG